jgi:hypothetical protein
MPYIVVKNGRYYSGAPLPAIGVVETQPLLDQRLVWTPYKKEAKRYIKKAWAEKAAQRVVGMVEEVRN